MFVRSWSPGVISSPHVHYGRICRPICMAPTLRHQVRKCCYCKPRWTIVWGWQNFQMVVGTSKMLPICQRKGVLREPLYHQNCLSCPCITMHNCTQQANPLAQESYWPQQTVRQQEQIQLRSCGQMDKGITRWLAHHRRLQHVRVVLNSFTWKQTSSPVNNFLSPNFSEPRLPGVCSLVTLHSVAAVVERLRFALRCW